MGRKTRIILVVLAFGAAVALVLAMAYAYVAFSPTGYDKIERKFDGAAERIGKGAGLVEKPVAPVRTSSAPQRAVEPVKDGGRASVAQEYDLLREMHSVAMIQNPVANTFINKYFGYDSQDHAVLECYFVPSPGGSLMEALTATEQQNLIQLARNYLVFAATMTEADADAINAQLDRVESLLLRPGKQMPKRVQIYGYWDGESCFRQGVIAIERACLRGDPAKALKLLDGLLETMRVCNLVYLSVTSEGLRPFVPDQTLWDKLATIENLPPEWREHAWKALEAMRATRVDRADALLVTARNWHDQSLSALGNDNSRRKNTWHYMCGGVPESALRKAMFPMAKRQIESMTIALGGGNQKEFADQLDSLGAIMGAMNLNLSGWHRGQARQMFEELDTRPVALAAQINHPIAVLRGWRKNTERRNAYSDIEFHEADTITLERFGTFKPDTWPLGSAVYNYTMSHNHPPTTPEEIEAFIKENGHGDDWRKLVAWCGPVRVKAFWGVPKDKRWNEGLGSRSKMKIVVRVEPAEWSLKERYRGVLVGRRK